MSRYQKLYRKAWREQNREHYTEYMRTYYLNRKHPCADCGQPCAPKHERCVTCENQRRAKHAVHP